METLRRRVEPIPPEEVGRAFRALSPPERRELLARLWAERGHETRVAEEDVIAAGDGEPRRIRVVDAGGWLGGPAVDDIEGADAVVATAPDATLEAAAAEAGVDYLDERALRDLLLYGIDRDRGAALCRELLGVEPLVDPAAEGSLPPVARLRTNAAPIVAVLVVAATLVAGAALPTTGGGGISVDDATPANVTEDVRGFGTESRTATETAAANATTAAPAGLTLDGVVDAEALAAAHERAVAARSYRFEYHFAGPASEEGFGDFRRIEIKATVEAGPHYLVEATFVPGNESEPTIGVAVFGDDQTQLIRRSVGGDVSYRRGFPGQGPGVTDDATDLVVRLLGPAGSMVVPIDDGDASEETFDVRVRDDPGTVSGAVRGYRAGALVHDDGFVQRLEASYIRMVDGEARQVQAGFVYRDVGVAVVDRPDWFDEATGANETSTDGTRGATTGGAHGTAGSSSDERRRWGRGAGRRAVQPPETNAVRSDSSSRPIPWPVG